MSIVPPTPTPTVTPTQSSATITPNIALSFEGVIFKESCLCVCDTNSDSDSSCENIVCEPPNILDIESCVCVPPVTNPPPPTPTPTPIIPCDRPSNITINGYAYYHNTPQTVIIPGLGSPLTSRCAGGHCCNSTNFFPELLSNINQVYTANTINVNNFPRCDNKSDTFVFTNIPLSFFQNQIQFRLRCADSRCHNGVVWIVLTATIDSNTILLFNNCVTPGRAKNLEYGCDTNISEQWYCLLGTETPLGSSGFIGNQCVECLDASCSGYVSFSSESECISNCLACLDENDPGCPFICPCVEWICNPLIGECFALALFDCTGDEVSKEECEATCDIDASI